MAAQATLSSAAFATTVASHSTRKESATVCNLQMAAQFSRGEIFGDKQLAVSAVSVVSPSTARSAWRLPVVSKVRLTLACSICVDKSSFPFVLRQC